MPPELINRLRILLRDVEADVKVEGGVVVPGNFWTDEELAAYLESALTVWNLWEPLSDNTPEEIGPQGRRYLLWGAAAIASQVAGIFPEEMAENCPYEYDGEAVDAWVQAKDKSLRRLTNIAESKWEQARQLKAS